MIDLDFSHELNNSCVKDLYWLLFSDCPINNRHPSLRAVPFFPLDILNSWKRTSDDYFKRLDRAPSELLHFLNRAKNKRLGFYAEALLSYFFQTFSEVKLLLQNYQLIEDKRTIGEIDFIIQWEGRIIHLECAVKYYLFNNKADKNELKNWVGPSTNDNLDRKIHKVMKSQLPLINSKIVLSEVESTDIESYLFLKGKLFVNSDIKCNWINKRSLGKYIFYDKLSQNEINLIRFIKKPYWLSVFCEKQFNEDVFLSENRFFIKRAHLVKLPRKYPLFVAPNDWPFK